MRPEIITVHDIRQAIDHAGVEPYANTLVQEMGGNFWFVEAALFTSMPESSDEEIIQEKVLSFGTLNEKHDPVLGDILPKLKAFYFEEDTPGHRYMEEIDFSDDTGSEKRWWKYRIFPVPLRLAYFIVEVLRLKAQFSRLGVGDIDEPVKRVVCLIPGTKIFGHEITELTEIPAELRPIVVEKL